MHDGATEALANKREAITYILSTTYGEAGDRSRTGDLQLGKRCPPVSQCINIPWMLPSGAQIIALVRAVDRPGAVLSLTPLLLTV